MTDSHTILLPYQAAWQDKFEAEKDKILKIFSNSAVVIEHIGSTSILGLSAKPIIDIGLLIEKKEYADKYIESVNELGYVYDELNSSGERYFFRKGNPTEFHLSIAYKDKGNFWERQILFRNYLRNHSDFRDEYQKLKENLLQADSTGKNSYISGKSEFVSKILELAKKDVNKINYNLSLIKSFLNEKVVNEKWYQDIKEYLKAVILYGSVAKGTNRPDSDIDLLFILPIAVEKKYTKGEYFISFKGLEFNIVIRSIEKLKEVASGGHDSFQAEIFRKSVTIWEKDSEVRMLVNKIVE